ncbi:hypothetical protein [Nocardia phage NC1]|nr:hypothetical protein [Nocardia phage NC1]QSL67773.1 hypothetical protein [Nocardia phage P69]
MKRAKIVHILTEQRTQIRLTFVQIDQIANALTGEPVDERFTVDPEDEHMADLINERYDDKHLG